MPNYLDDVYKAHDAFDSIRQSVRRRVKNAKDEMKDPAKPPVPEEKKDGCASKKKDEELCPECKKAPCVCKKEMPPEDKKDGCASKKKDEALCPECKKAPCECKKEEKKDGCASKKKDEFPPKKEEKEDPEMKKKEEEKKKQDSITSIPKAVQDQVSKSVFEGFAHINDGVSLLKNELKDAAFQEILTKINTLRDELANTLQSKIESKK